MPSTSLAPGTETLINRTATAYQTRPATVGLAGGGHVAVWDTGDYKSDIRAQRFDAGGAQVGGEIRLSDAAAGSQRHVLLAARPDDGFGAV
ncbi:MAG TPA: hypothetical protein VEY95_11070 [Azospirillaceae bacterium]|nr:hypothetical protein [Azospirillaceae bacterium]